MFSVNIVCIIVSCYFVSSLNISFNISYLVFSIFIIDKVLIGDLYISSSVSCIIDYSVSEDCLVSVGNLI